MKYKTVKPREVCPSCKQTIKPEVKKFFCDQCDKGLAQSLGEGELGITVFRHGLEITDEHFYFCSWKCCLGWVKTHRDDFEAENFYFFNLPHVTERNQREFFKEIIGHPEKRGRRAR